jgi:signal transduction histidine kinase
VAGVGWGFLRPRSVRAKVVSLLMVPVVALMALWGLAMVTVAGDALTVQQVSRIQEQVRVPLDRTITALQAERSAVVHSLGGQKPQTTAGAASANAAGSASADAAASASADGVAGLGSPESATDAAIGTVRSGVASAQVEIAGLPTVSARTSALTSDFASLAGLRTEAATGQIQPVDAYAAYTEAVSDAQAVQSSLDAVHATHTASTGVVVAAWLGLVAIVVSLLISVRIGQALVTELVVLRDSALDLAGRRLPAAIARLRAGQDVDLAAEAPIPPAAAGGDEIGQVTEALAVVQHAALEAAVERAEVISGVAGVFRNLARRSQTLVHRQLALLEAMERRVDDPGELEDLFRLDHLATRMQRHAEGLIILSGSPPGRGWRRPVPLMDVVRAAAAEVEDFARVDVRRMPPVAVAGGAVADLTHLVAELVENATAFSPPHSRVVVRGRPITSGCVIEVEDQGLGMGQAALGEANRRIADSRPDDLFESDRLGLYVVSRLARRHGVEVALRAGADQGTVAIIMLPAAVLADEDEDRPQPGIGMLTRAEALADEGSAADVDALQSQSQSQSPMPAPASAPPPPPLPMPAPEPAPRPEPALAANGLTPAAPQTAGLRADASARTSENGLPRRVRQASLAVQLRTPRPAPPPADPPADASAPGRDPETVRATMAAFQQGWTRGRGGPEPKENA